MVSHLPRASHASFLLVGMALLLSACSEREGEVADEPLPEGAVEVFLSPQVPDEETGRRIRWSPYGQQLALTEVEGGMEANLVLGPEGNGTLNAWGREWQQVPVGLAQVVRMVTASLQSFPGRQPEFPFAFLVGDSRRTGIIPRPGILGSEPAPAGDGDVWRYQLAPLVRHPNPGH